MYEFKKIFKRNHRIVCLLLSCFLSFGTVATEYLEVQAFDWVAPTLYLPFVDAMPYLMGMLGVAPSNDDSIDWDAWRDDYEEHALNGDFNITQDDLNDWISDVSNGRLNQVSDCWTAFKDWVLNSRLFNQGALTGNSISAYISAIPYDFAFDYDLTVLDENFDNVLGYFILNSDNKVTGLYLYSNASVEITKPYDNTVRYRITSDSGRFFQLNDSHKGGLIENYSAKTINFSNLSSYSLFISQTSEFFNEVSPPAFADVYLWDFMSSDSFIDYYNKSLINNLSLALSNAISDAIPDVIPLPWEQIGDTVDEVKDYIDGLIEQVNAGVISISDYMRAVLDRIGALAVDTVTGLLYPQNPDKPDETLDDKANENKNNQGFVLFGLEKVFPFCIPFDIYAFLTLLVAEPVAPVINWPVYNPITQQNEIITIDFSTWNSVVVLFRYIFDFLFIIGMLLMARALIGGGDSA